MRCGCILCTMEVRITSMLDWGACFRPGHDSRCLQRGLYLGTGSSEVLMMILLLTLLEKLCSLPISWLMFSSSKATNLATTCCCGIEVKWGYLWAKQLRVILFHVMGRLLSYHGSILDWERHVRWITHPWGLILVPAAICLVTTCLSVIRGSRINLVLQIQFSGRMLLIWAITLLNIEVFA